MYYSVDDEGNIVMSESNEILPDVYQDIFPSYDSDFYIDDVISVSSGDQDIITYDNLYDLLAAIPGYNVYPNTSAVSVFTNVLNGLDGDFGYVILSGADTNSTYLYYSNIYSVSGKTIYLSSPVTFCNYYSYRPSTNSNYIYTYNVSILGDTSFNINNQLVYTNLLEGYPDVLPYKSKESYSLFFIIALSILLLLFAILKNSKRRL